MIVIDGIVGVGKSTLMKILAEKYNLTAYKEPVVNNTLLEKFYYNRERFSFPLQIFFFNKRLEQLKEASYAESSILDRSIYGDLIFAKLLKENNELSQEEYDVYTDLFNNMNEHIPTPKLLIYLDISVDNAISRIEKRGREYELATEKSYWQNLSEKYSNFFNDYPHSKILKINVDNIDFENNPNDREYVLSLIDDALAEINQKSA